MVKKGQQKERERIGHVLNDLIVKVTGLLTDRSPSSDRIHAVFEAAQLCTVRLVHSKSDSLRVCIYQLEYEEEPQAHGSKPGVRPIKQAHLVRVVEPHGRGLDPARDSFDYDAQGIHTLDRIVANKHVWCPDTSKANPKLEDGRTYKAFLSVPIRVDSQVEGMLTCDSRSRGDLEENMVPLLRMTAIVAGIALNQKRLNANEKKAGESPEYIEPEMPQLDKKEVS